MASGIRTVGETGCAKERQKSVRIRQASRRPLTAPALVYAHQPLAQLFQSEQEQTGQAKEWSLLFFRRFGFIVDLQGTQVEGLSIDCPWKEGSFKAFPESWLEHLRFLVSKVGNRFFYLTKMLPVR